MLGLLRMGSRLRVSLLSSDTVGDIPVAFNVLSWHVAVASLRGS